MRAQRIKTGFHRIGLILAVVCGAPGIIALLVSIPVYLGWVYEPRGPADDMWQAWLMGGIVGIVLAGLGYAAAAALGWVIAGFAGDGESSK
jgi:hypothetical protein